MLFTIIIFLFAFYSHIYVDIQVFPYSVHAELKEKMKNSRTQKGINKKSETALMMKDRTLELKPFHDFSALNKLEKFYKLKNVYFVYKKEL